MPARSASRQPDGSHPWFKSPEGQAVLLSEEGLLRQAWRERPGMPVLWLAASHAILDEEIGFCVRLAGDGDVLTGDLRCGPELPLASEAIGTVILQHVAESRTDIGPLLAECARVLLPGGRLWVFALNPLGLYRWHWSGEGLRSCEPVTWRRRMRAQGLQPEPVSLGLGPRWRAQPLADVQTGAGARAAYLLRGEKQVAALTRIRQPALSWQPSLPTP